MKALSDTIHNVLSKNNYSFYIPPFQRVYSWEEQELERYIYDISRIIESELDPNQKDKLEHFFGTIVLKEEDAQYSTKAIIIDGQQRLTTTLIFLIALRNNIDSKEQKEFINKNYLYNDSSPFVEKIKLKQVTNDWKAYQSIILEKGFKDKNHKIIKAYEYFYKKIKTMFSKDPRLKFEHFILTLKRLNVAVIFLDERPHKGEDPQVIFETLNSMGKALTLSDLIRNYVLLKFDTSQQDQIYDEIWHKKIENVLGEQTSYFFRDYLQYKKQEPLKVVNASNTKDLYQRFRDFVEENFSNRVNDFVNDIVKYVKLYKWIVFDHQDLISNDVERNLKIKELLKDIFHHIETKAFKPFVMGLLEYHQYGKNDLKIQDESLIEMLETIRTYLIRRRIFGLTQGENKDIVKLSKKIPDLARNKVTMMEVLSNLFYKLRLPNDLEVEEQLKEVNFDKEYKKYAKFILAKIEERNSGKTFEWENDSIVIEHIMPVNLNISWQKELGENYHEIHNKYLYNIGNLILTDFKKEMIELTFSEKKKRLQQSKLFYKNFIINKTQWNLESILEHQSTMIKWFLETFSLPEEYKHRKNWNTNVFEGESISPLDPFVEEAARGSTPMLIRIFENKIYVDTWQDVFIEFINFFKNDPNYDFDSILKNQDELFSKDDVIIDGSTFKLKASKRSELLKRYKTLQGELKKSVLEISDDEYYIHVNISSANCLERIAKLMKKFSLNEKDVEILID
jgi:uncharacterized protein with ParB-like and HNH nuclease domain